MRRYQCRTAVAGFVAAAFAITFVGCGESNPIPDAGTDGSVAPDTGPPPMPALTLTPSTQDYGDVVSGQHSSAVTFTVRNTGTGPTAPMMVTLGGSGAGDFAISSNSCAAAVLAPAGTCSVAVTFSPTAEHNAMATLTATDGAVHADSTLQGRGIHDAGLSISPTPYSFGTTTVATASAAASFTVTNTGDATSGTINITLGGLDSTQFQLGTDDCSGMTLAGRATCTVEVTYAPTSAGDHTASVQASASPGSTVSGAISGHAQLPASLRVVPNMRDFGSVVTGMTSTSVDFLVTNLGGASSASLANAMSGPNASEFTIDASTCAGAPLAGGASCTITVTFHAGPAGARSASLDVTAASLSASAALTATSLTAGSISISPTSHDFGAAQIGVASGATTFTITNTGGASVGPMIVAIAGANPADFPIVAGGDGCSGATLAGGGSCTVAVQFVAASVGVRTAVLVANGGSATLSGTGQSAPLIVVSPSAADFGAVATGSSSSLSFTVTNTGGAPTGAIEAVLTGLEATQFSILSVGACSAPLPGGASCTITVAFSPTSIGMQAAVLDVHSPSGGGDTADIGGIGITPASLTLTPTLNLGNVAETDSATGNLILWNSGAESVTALTITPPADSHFTLVPAAFNPCGATLAGFSGCNIGVRFTPTEQGPLSSTLVVVATPGGTLSSALSATGIADLRIRPTSPSDSFDLGSVVIGAVVTRSFNVTNQTVRTHTLALPVVAGADFSNGGGTCTAGLMLAPGATCRVIVRYAPTGAAGPRSATLTASGSEGVTESADLTASAAGPLRFRDWQITRPGGGVVTSTYPAAFGDRAIGNYYEVTLTALNASPLPTQTVMTSSSFASDLNIVTDSCSGVAVPPLTTCNVVVRFYPRTPAPVTGSVTLTYGPNSATGNVTGNGIIGASIGVTGSADFGSVIATRTLDRMFTVTNASPAQATSTLVYSVSGSPEYALVTGPGAGTCSASGSAPLPPSGSCTIAVRYSPLITDSTSATTLGTLVVSQGAQTVNTNLTGHAASQITLTPSTASFQTGTGTTSATTQFTVTNVGAVNTGSIVVAMGSFASEFPITNNTCGTLTPGAACTFDVAFAASGADRNNVQVRASNGAYAAGSARIATSLVSGDSASNPTLSAFPATAPTGCNFFSCPPGGRFYFGRVVEGANSAAHSFVISNGGDLPVPAGAISATISANPAAFDVVGTTCGAGVAGHASCTVDVRFSPAVGTGGNIMDGTLRVAGMPGGTTLVFLNGTSMLGVNVTTTPTPYDFGSTTGGVPIGPIAFMLSNNSGTPQTITGFLDDSNFHVTAGTCAVGTVIPGGATCTVNVTYSPPAAGPFGFDQGAVTVVFPGGFDDAVMAVSGRSLAPAALSVTPPDPVGFPTTVSGASSAQGFVVTNTGGVPMTAAPSLAITGADPTQFAIANNTCMSILAAGATCTFDVNFTPVGAGLRNATLSVTAGVLAATRALSGTGIGAGLLGISPSVPQTCPDHFAGSGVSATYSCVSYTISNGGGSAALVSASITGDFIVDPSSTCVAAPMLAVGGTCTVIVLHTPQTVGADSGVLTVSAPGIASVTGTVGTNGLSALTASGSGSFGSASVGSAGMTRTFTFTNMTDPSTGILFYGLTGSGDFDVQSDTCSGTAVPRPGTCTISVHFVPSALGAQTATLTVGDGTAEKTATVTLTGTGT